MNWDLIFAVIFYCGLFIFFLKYRSRFEVQGKIFALYKTKLGLKLMDKLGTRWKKFWHYTSYFSIFIGFFGMAFIFYFLIKGTLGLIMKPDSNPILSPVLPGISIPGLPVLSFWHWIFAILIVAVIHEFCHGVFARANNIKIKSSGFAFLGPILAAFVEPNEKQMARKSKHAQLSVLAGGPFSNIVFAGLVIILSLFIVNPLASNLVEFQGVQVIDVVDGLPLSLTDIKVGDHIDKINGIELKNPAHFVEVLSGSKAGDVVEIQSNGNVDSVTLVEKDGKPIMGVSVAPIKQDFKEGAIEKYGTFWPSVAIWFVELMFRLYAISFGIGLFNLLPLGPVDGGKMFYIGMLAIFKNKKVALGLFNAITLFCLFLIVVNLLPYIWKLIKFIGAPLLLLF